MRMRTSIFLAVLFFVSVAGCGGVYDYRLVNVQSISMDGQLPGDVSLKVASEDIYHHSLGIKSYRLFVKDAIERQYKDSLGKCFEKGINDNAETGIIITVLDTSTFPISTIINDIRLFFRIEIMKKGDVKMEKQKTVMIYGFGSDPDGNKAMEKAVGNSVYQLLPILEEMFIRH